MPLKDRDKSRPRRLVRLGHIRLGHKEKKEKKRQDGTKYTVEYPVQDDHFILTDAPEIAEFYAARGITEVHELDVILPFPDIPRNFDAFYTVWAGGVLMCKGDGEQVLYAAPFTARETKGRMRVRNATGETLVSDGQAKVAFDWNDQRFKPGDIVPCPGDARDMYPHCQVCRISAILKVMMAHPELIRLGYYQVSTGSKRNYDTLLCTLELISGNGQRPVNGIPFKLRLVKETTTYTENGKRHATEKFFLQLEPDPVLTRQLYQQQAARLITPELPASVDTNTGEITGEWDEAEPAGPPPFAEEGGPAEEGSAYDDAEPVPPLGTEELSESAAPVANGQNGRPLPPEKVREFLTAKITKAPPAWQTGRATSGQRGLLVGKLTECFAPADDADDKRRAVLVWLIGKESSKELVMAEASALLDWLLDKEADDGTYDLHPAVASEAKAIYREAVKEAGQQEMAL